MLKGKFLLTRRFEPESLLISLECLKVQWIKPPWPGGRWLRSNYHENSKACHVVTLAGDLPCSCY